MLRNKLVITMLFFLVSCMKSDLKQIPLPVVDKFDCGTQNSYLVDINKDGKKNKLNFIYDHELKKIRAFVFIDAHYLEIDFLNRPQFDPNSTYSFKIVETDKPGFGFSISCESDHYEFYSYKNNKFKVITYEEP